MPRNVLLAFSSVACAFVLVSACAAPGAEHGPSQDTLRPSPGGAAPAELGGFASLPGRPSAVGPVASSDVIKPDCVPSSGPPYQIGLVGSFSGGSVALIPGVSVTGLTGVFCAVATLVAAPPDHPDAKVCANLVALPDDLQFDPVTTTITLIPGVTSVIGNVNLSPDKLSAYLCDDGLPGPLALSTTISASAVPDLFGTSCLVGPIQAAVAGSITGNLRDATAVITSGTFPVAAVQAGPHCPAGLAANANAILGLPLQASGSGLTLTAHAALYLPPSP